MKRQKLTEDYEFTVKKFEDEDYSLGYSVYLPHQCDDWEIIGWEADESPYSRYCESKGEAVKQMELFIKRAQEALEKLKNL